MTILIQKLQNCKNFEPFALLLVLGRQEWQEKKQRVEQHLDVFTAESYIKEQFRLKGIAGDL